MWQTFLIDVIKKVAVGESSDGVGASASGTKIFVRATQGEVGVCFRAVLLCNGEPYYLSDGMEFSVWYEGASGKGNYTQIDGRTPVTISGNVLQIELIPQMITVAGGGTLGVMLHECNGIIRKLFDISYIVDEFPGYGSEEASAYFTAFSEAVAGVMDSMSEVSEEARNVQASAAKLAEIAAAFETDDSLSVAGKPADAAKIGKVLAGKAPLALGAPHNYLDNSDFRNPVNQRAFTSLSNASAGTTYVADRWIWWNVDGGSQNVTLIKGTGLSVGEKNGSAWLFQKLDPDSFDSTQNYSAYCKCSDGTLVKGIVDNTTWGGSTYSVLFNIPAGKVAIWAVCYEGEYSEETLPEYKPKGYVHELLECQQYYWQTCHDTDISQSHVAIVASSQSTGKVEHCIFPVTMRKKPTISIKGIMVNGSTVVPTSVSPYGNRQGLNALWVGGVTFTANTRYQMLLSASADL